MIDAIIIIFIIYYIYKKANQKSSKTLLYQMFSVQKFSNIKEIAYEGDIVYIRADGKGENFLFAVKNSPTGITQNLINRIKEKSQQLHIHNVIFVTTSISDVNVIRNLKANNIKYWDNTTIKSFLMPNLNTENAINNTSKPTILSTSDTSNDKCKIEPSSYDPIQEGEYKVGSIFSGLFDKPDRL